MLVLMSCNTLAAAQAAQKKQVQWPVNGQLLAAAQAAQKRPSAVSMRLVLLAAAQAAQKVTHAPVNQRR